MDESIILSESVKAYFSSHASLAALGRKMKKLKVFEPITQKVKIAQKTVKYSPSEKLMDAFITLLAGAQGLVEVNKRLKADVGLQRAFGRTGCAEQSVVQDTLDACSAENVDQMHQAMAAIFRRHSQTYRHDYQLNWQVLDADMTGRPCGKKAKFASKGYFAKQRNRRGRQEGYVIGTWYEEIVVERLFGGKIQLNQALRPLIKPNASAPSCASTRVGAAWTTSTGSWSEAIRCMARIIPGCEPRRWPRASANGSAIRVTALARWAG